MNRINPHKNASPHKGKVTKMKIAVLSDIHSNYSALEACLAFAKHLGAEGYVFLGDLVSDFAYPNDTIARLRALSQQNMCYFVRGNREEYLIRHRKNPNDGWKPSSQTGSLLYTYENLTAEDMDFIEGMGRSARIEIEDCPPILACHGSPSQPDEIVYPGSERCDALLAGMDAQVMLVGHSHSQFRYEAGGRQMINPGAVGSPVNGQTKAQFSLLDCQSGRWRARMLNVDYDIAGELRRFDQSGLKDVAFIWALMAREQLRTGRSRAEQCIELARALGQLDKNAPIDEVYFENAAKELGII